jgi:hypothetical protein
LPSAALTATSLKKKKIIHHGFENDKVKPPVLGFASWIASVKRRNKNSHACHSVSTFHAVVPWASKRFPQPLEVPWKLLELLFVEDTPPAHHIFSSKQRPFSLSMQTNWTISEQWIDVMRLGKGLWVAK